MTRMNSCMLIAVLLLSGCGFTKQVNVVGHKTPIPGQSAEPALPPEKEEVVLPKEPEQEITVLPEPIVIELERPPQATAFEPPEVISEPKLPPPPTSYSNSLLCK